VSSLSAVSRKHVDGMLEVIERAYAEHVTLQMLAMMFGRQAAYLGRLFHKEVGMTVRECVTRVRLEHAAMLILNGAKIEAVALGVGYHSKKNFYRQFKRYFALTPDAFRRNGQEPSALARLEALRLARSSYRQPPTV
jgi:YesN/AraC family two-component response regulator